MGSASNKAPVATWLKHSTDTCCRDSFSNASLPSLAAETSRTMADFTEQDLMEESLIQEELAAEHAEQAAAEQEAAAAAAAAAEVPCAEPSSVSFAPQPAAVQPAEATASAPITHSQTQPLTYATLRATAKELLTGQDFTDCTVGQLRGRMEVRLNLPPGTLDSREEVVKLIAIQLVCELSPKQSAPHSETFDEDAELGEEPDTSNKWSYLITFSHPKRPTASDGTPLRPPGELSRSQIRLVLLEALEGTQSGRKTPLKFKYMAVFQERHATGEIHYHVALLAERQFKFKPLKLHLLHTSHLASHWSVKHVGYAAAVSYGYLGSPKKDEGELDATPHLWAREDVNGGIHPPLEDASRPPTNAAALAKWREDSRKARAVKGKKELRVRPVDLWPVVVAQNIPASAGGPEMLMAWAKRCGGEAMVEFLFTNWPKVPEFISRSWQVERVEETADKFSKTRLELLKEAACKPCVCGGGCWRRAAMQLFQANGIAPADWAGRVLDSLVHGRRKGRLICHAGLVGNEGKSFLLGPLPEVYGHDGVFLSPSSANFPLMGLENARVVLLDDWRFNETLLSYNLQLLWFEGKPLVIARPQNQFSGHVRYSGDAPIFITTLEADIMTIPEGLQAGDVEMMLKRLTIFRFHVPLTRPADIASCGRCFAEMLLELTGASAAGSDAQMSTGHPAPPVLPVHEDRQRQQQADVPPPPVASARAADFGTKRMAPGPTGSTPDAKKSANWSVEDVCNYLVRLELPHVTDNFRKNGVDGSFLADLTQEDLVNDLGLTRLQAMKVKTRLP